MFTVIIVVCSLKSMCLPSFVLIGCCVSELRGPYRNVLFINPRRACARVTVVGSVCLSVSVCLLLNITLFQCSFVLQTIRLT